MILPNLLRERLVPAAITLCLALSVVTISPLVEAKPRGRAKAQSYYYAGRSGPARTWLKLTRIGNKLQGRTIYISVAESEIQVCETRHLRLSPAKHPEKMGWMMEDEDGSTLSLVFQTGPVGTSKVGAIGDERLILKHNDTGDTVTLLRTGAAEFDKALRLHEKIEQLQEDDDPETICRRILPTADFPHPPSDG